MELKILSENCAYGKYKAEHGLSYYIKHDHEILFDTGHSGIFLENAKQLNVDIDKIDTVVLSHGHWDHGDGLQYLDNKKLICHPGAFRKRYRKGGTENIGIQLSKSELSNKFRLHTTKSPYKITDNIIFLGEIPRSNSFESKSTPFVFEDQEDDFVPDDSGLAIIAGNEIIVISGCAHSGICNMINYAIKITGIPRVKSVIGGFHLRNNDIQTKQTIEFLITKNIMEIYPSHCTDLPALCAFYKTFNIKQLKTGLTLTFHKK